MKKESFDWKTLAIVLIVVCVLETTAFIGLVVVGSNMIEAEEECAEVCYEESGFYYYDDYEQKCYCVESDGEYYSSPGLEGKL